MEEFPEKISSGKRCNIALINIFISIKRFIRERYIPFESGGCVPDAVRGAKSSTNHPDLFFLAKRRS